MIFPEKSILRSFEIFGFELKGEHWFLSDVINDTEFKGFCQYDKGFYAYLGKLDDQEEMQTYLDDLDIVLYRTEKKLAELMGNMCVGFIINSEIDISDFIKNAESMVSKYDRFSLTYNKNSEILFGDIKVNLDYLKLSL